MEVAPRRRSQRGAHRGDAVLLLRAGVTAACAVDAELRPHEKAGAQADVLPEPWPRPLLAEHHTAVGAAASAKSATNSIMRERAAGAARRTDPLTLSWPPRGRPSMQH